MLWQKEQHLHKEKRTEIRNKAKRKHILQRQQINSFAHLVAKTAQKRLKERLEKMPTEDSVKLTYGDIWNDDRPNEHVKKETEFWTDEQEKITGYLIYKTQHIIDEYRKTYPETKPKPDSRHP